LCICGGKSDPYWESSTGIASGLCSHAPEVYPLPKQSFTVAISTHLGLRLSHVSDTDSSYFCIFHQKYFCWQTKLLGSCLKLKILHQILIWIL